MKKVKSLLLKAVWCVLCFSIWIVAMPSEGQASAPTLPVTTYTKIYCEKEGERIKLSDASEIEFLVSVRNDDNFLVDKSSLNVSLSFDTLGKLEIRMMSLNENDSFKYMKRLEEKADGKSFEFLPLTAGEFVLTTCISMSTAIDDPSGRFYDFLNPDDEDVYGEKAETLRFKVDFSELASRWRDTGYFDKETGYNIQAYARTYGYENPVDGLRYATGENFDMIYFYIYGDYIAFLSESSEEARRIAYGEFDYFWNVTVRRRFKNFLKGCN